MPKTKETEEVKTETNRPLEALEYEFVRALEMSDIDTIVELIQERPDLTVFFCAAATINKGSPVIRSAAERLPAEMSKEKAIIKRMSNNGQKNTIASTTKNEITQIEEEIN